MCVCVCVGLYPLYTIVLLVIYYTIILCVPILNIIIMRITYYYYSDCFPFWAGTLYTITATIVIVFDISPPFVGCKYKIVA